MTFSKKLKLRQQTSAFYEESPAPDQVIELDESVYSLAEQSEENVETEEVEEEEEGLDPDIAQPDSTDDNSTIDIDEFARLRGISLGEEDPLLQESKKIINGLRDDVYLRVFTFHFI